MTTQSPLQTTDLRSIIISQAFIDRVLTPYKAHVRYLQSAEILGVEPIDNSKGGLIAQAQFRISESCYIDDTGHFNSVEFNICLNQLLYVTVGHAIKNDLFGVVSPAWASTLNYDYAHFLDRQLSDMLILKIEGTFRQQIPSGAPFSGQVHFKRFFCRGNTLFMQADISFSHGGIRKSNGTVLTSFIPRIKK